ncbi:hypothetical protein MUG91_G28n52 [Manis pentadactyla]|nr:hypothetical protein MUG91_G28n52 [Manis pentadactyla]
MPGSGCSLPSPPPPPTLHRRPLRRTRARGEPRGLALRAGPHPFPGPARGRAAGEVNGKMEMDVEGVSPRSEPIPRSQGAGGACPAPPPPPQPQPRPRPRPQPQPQPPPQQQLAQDDPPGESAGAEDSDDPEARPHSEKGESKYFSDRIHSGELGQGWLRTRLPGGIPGKGGRLHGLKGDGFSSELPARSQRSPASGCSNHNSHSPGEAAGGRPGGGIASLPKDGPPSQASWGTAAGR